MHNRSVSRTAATVLCFAACTVVNGAEFDLSVVSTPPTGHSTSTVVDQPLQFSTTGQSLSEDGRFVVFNSNAANLPGGDAQSLVNQAYLFDEQNNAITLLSPTGNAQPASIYTSNAVISGDGNLIGFSMDAVNEAGNTISELLITNRTNTNVQTLSELLGRAAGSTSYVGATLNRDGRFIAFISEADNLVPNDTNGVADLFVLDRATSAVSRVNVASDGTQSDEPPISATISDSGDMVSFVSAASTLVSEATDQNEHLFVHTRSTGETTRVVANTVSTPTSEVRLDNAVMSGNGQFFAFVSSSDALALGIRSRVDRVYRYNRSTGETELASLIEPVSGDINDQLIPASSPTISSDGQKVGFAQSAGFALRDFGTNQISTLLDETSELFSFERFLKDVQVSGDGQAAVLTTQRFATLALAFATRRSHYLRFAEGTLKSFEGTVQPRATADDTSTSVGDGSVSGDGRFVVFAT